MKKLSLTVFWIFAAWLCAAQGLVTTEAVRVAEDYGNQHPQLELLNDGRAGISWTDVGTKSIFFAKHNGFDGFNAPMQLNPVGLEVQSYTWSGPDFAVDGDHVYVIFRSFGHETGHVYCVKSTDNGATFGDTVRVDHLSEGFAQFPDVAVFNDTVFVTFMAHDADGSHPTYQVARSIDGGATFEDAVPAAALVGDEVCDCCPPEIIANEDRIILFFRNNAENIRDIKAVISYDRGGSFTDWISVDDHNWLIDACPSTGPDARFGEDGMVYSTYKSQDGGAGKVFFNAYDLETDASTDLVEIYATEGLSAALNYPQLCMGNDLIGVVWEDVVTGTAIDVFFNYSGVDVIDFNPDNALNLTALVGVQSKPDIAEKGGVFHVVYADAVDGDLYYLQVGEPNAIAETEISFRVYQPTTKSLVLEADLTEPAVLEVVDLEGRLILSQTVTTNRTEISTADWDTGLYVVRLKQNDVWAVQKIVH